jgi:hypothetical protein
MEILARVFCAWVRRPRHALPMLLTGGPGLSRAHTRFAPTGLRIFPVHSFVKIARCHRDLKQFKPAAAVCSRKVDNRQLRIPK